MRGLIANITSGLNPNFSKTPGRKGSITISAVGRRALTKSTPAGAFRSTAMEDLWRVRRSPVTGSDLAASECV